MPTYEYRCERCAHTVEVVQSFSDAPLTTCESCGGALRKVYAPVGIVFKGSGFYKTDSRSSSKVAAKSGSGSEGAASSDKADATATPEKKDKSDATSSATPPSAPSNATPAPAPAGAAKPRD
jgi:putative FmdB family regulatory protein